MSIHKNFSWIISEKWGADPLRRIVRGGLRYVGNQYIQTFKNSGGGFFPLHKLDKHHTALRVIDKRFALLNNLKKEKMYLFNSRLMFYVIVEYIQCILYIVGET